MTNWVKTEFTIPAIESLIISDATSMNETFNGLAKHFMNKEVCHQSPKICEGQVSAAANRWNLGPSYILETCKILNISISQTQIRSVNDVIKDNKKSMKRRKISKEKKKETTKNNKQMSPIQKKRSNSNQSTNTPKRRRILKGYKSGAYPVR